MSVRVVVESPETLGTYGEVPIRFLVAEAYDEAGIAALLEGAAASACALREPYWKDYDAYPDNSPSSWAARSDVDRWTILAAYLDERRVGGAIVLTGEPDVDSGDERGRCALLWDIRVEPEQRGRGVGTSLLHAVEGLARARGAGCIRVETQQINVPACRFYQRHGYGLESATSGAYAGLPEEVQLMWSKPLP